MDIQETWKINKEVFYFDIRNTVLDVMTQSPLELQGKHSFRRHMTQSL